MERTNLGEGSSAAHTESLSPSLSPLPKANVSVGVCVCGRGGGGVQELNVRVKAVQDWIFGKKGRCVSKGYRANTIDPSCEKIVGVCVGTGYLNARVPS
jgi:hypothetical protein